MVGISGCTSDQRFGQFEFVFGQRHFGGRLQLLRLHHFLGEVHQFCGDQRLTSAQNQTNVCIGNKCFGMHTLTRKQQQVWNFISESQQRLGMAPSIREIQNHFAFGSTRSAFDYVKVLAKKGYLKREPRTARAIQIIDQSAPPPKSTISIPVYGSIPAGLPEERTQTPDDYITMDLETLGIPKSSTRIFALRVKGDSMEGAGILDGDWAIIDHAKEPRAGGIVAAYIDGKSTLKRFLVRQGKPYLKAENPRYPDLTPCEELMVQGVFIGLYRKAL